MKHLFAVVILFILVAITACAGGRGERESEPPESSVDVGARYVEYTPERFEDASGEFHRVYFFHASWCPSCRRAHREFRDNPDQIPENVVIFKLDYDTEAQLRREFAVVYQHTFVLVDEGNNLIQKWTGGDLGTLIASVRDHT